VATEGSLGLWLEGDLIGLGGADAAGEERERGHHAEEQASAELP
jgi:hypothetical protein